MKKLLLIFLISFSFSLLANEGIYKKKGIISKIKPMSVTEDSEGNTYVADRYSRGILKYNKKGRYLYSFGVKYKVKRAEAMPLISDIFYYGKRLYVLDINFGLYVFNGEGELFEWYQLPKGKLLGEFNAPQSLYVDSENIYIVDTGNSRVQIFDKTMNIIRDFGYKGSNDNSLFLPTGVTKLRDKILISDTGNNFVNVYDKNGIFERGIGMMLKGSENAGSFKSPEDIFVDKAGYIYIVDKGNGRIQIFDKNFKLYAKFGKKKKNFNGFIDITDVWAGKEYIYVTDSVSRRTYKYNRELELIGELGVNKVKRVLSMILIIIIVLTLFVRKIIKNMRRGL